MKLTDRQTQILEESNINLLILLEEAESINSDDEPDGSQDAPEEQQQEEEQEEEEQSEEEQPSEEDIFNYELQGTEDKFLQFTLYDKLVSLDNKIKILLDTIQNNKSVEAINLVAKLEHYIQYIKVLNELIFSISTSVVYKVLGQIELELIELLEIYNANLEKKDK